MLERVSFPVCDLGLRYFAMSNGEWQSSLKDVCFACWITGQKVLLPYHLCLDGLKYEVCLMDGFVAVHVGLQSPGIQ